MKMIIKINALKLDIVNETLQNIDCSEWTRHMRRSHIIHYRSWSYRQSWHLHRSAMNLTFTPRR